MDTPVVKNETPASSTVQIARAIIDILEDKKGEEILLLDVRELSDFTDYFIICTGTSDRMLQALADSVIEGTNQRFHLKGKIEGQAQDGWLLIDYIDILVHLLSPDRRAYYRLEDLWSKGKVVVRLV